MRLVSRRVVISTIAGLVIVGSWAGAVGYARQKAASSMATAANAFLTGLTPEQRQKATYPLVSEEWTRWHFIPTNGFPRNGLPFAEMTDEQRKRAHDLMRASLSAAGYTTATSIMQLEVPLKAIETAAAAARAAAAGPAPAAPAAGGQGGAARGGRGGGQTRDPNLYYFTVFGNPTAKGSWGWRAEGHHLSLHFAIDNLKMQVTSTPQFMGTNPAQVPEGYAMAGTRVLGAQEDLARALVMALNDKQRGVALVSPKPGGDIKTATTVRVSAQEPAGLVASEMTAAQREMLMRIIESYSSVMPPDVAANRLAKIKAAGTEKLTFAWAGSTDKGQQYHYQVQGPTFVIEHNNTQNNGNHIHSVWRDFNGDFGRDLLAEHMAALPH
jgi:hypothetical protein